MLYKDYTREFIGFEDVTVTFAERKDNQFHIHMKMKRKAHKCPRCGRTTEKIHDYREQRIKDISSFGSYTFIHLIIPMQFDPGVRFKMTHPSDSD
ncbi:transposase family protein [Thermoclostridium caenicola]|uniref:transposase family protein n=1 Tax=Thermoclostridium caenicola TaxID=659425 RepID=UPI002D1F9B47|nr:transposase family protein [Thermoclostridium caenicola]